jgi:hypothetical protein
LAPIPVGSICTGAWPIELSPYTALTPYFLAADMIERERAPGRSNFTLKRIPSKGNA